MEWITLHLPWAGLTVLWPAIIVLGVMVGFLSGLLGVGGGFLLTPALFVIFNVPYPFAVGSTLAQMIFASLFGALRHWKLGNVEGKLAIALLSGAVVGVEAGARTLEELKFTGTFSAFGREWNILDLALSAVYILLLVWIGVMMLTESRSALRRPARGGVVSTRVSRWVHSRPWPPMIRLSNPQTPALPFWVISGMGFFGGFCTGLLGVGGGFVLVPTMIFGLGIPTTMAVGTGLVLTMFSALAGTITHVLKHNVDWTLAGLILLGTATGVHSGVRWTMKIRGAHIRLVFAVVTLLSAAGIALKVVLM